MRCSGVSEEEDAALLHAARSGDHRAGEALVRRHAPGMLRTAWSVVGRYSSAEVQDIVQEAFIAALTTSALPRGDVAAWLRSITARKALDWLRQPSTRAERASAEAMKTWEPLAAADPTTPLAVLSVRAALARLPERDRAVLTLVDLEGFSMAEAAAALGSTVVAVKWRAVRARRRLKAILEGSEADD